MTDLELIKALQHCSKTDTGCSECPRQKLGEPMLKCTANVIREAIDRLQALIAENERLKVQGPKWISVKDHLPKLHTEKYDDFGEICEYEVSETVWGLTADKKTIAVHCTQDQNGAVWFGEQDMLRKEVTHWMPLPVKNTNDLN